MASVITKMEKVAGSFLRWNKIMLSAAYNPTQQCRQKKAFTLSAFSKSFVHVTGTIVV